MSYARCTECGGEAPREPRSYIRHEPGCPNWVLLDPDALTYAEQRGGPPAVVTAHVTTSPTESEAP